MMIYAISRYQLQSLADDTALKRERQQAELALRTKLIERSGTSGVSLEHVLNLEVDATTSDGLDAELAKQFGSIDAPPDEIERALGRAMAVSAERKREILNVMSALFENDAEHEAILATVRALCGHAVVREEVPVPMPRG
jgi:hypothetical protein